MSYGFASYELFNRKHRIIMSVLDFGSRRFFEYIVSQNDFITTNYRLFINWQIF